MKGASLRMASPFSCRRPISGTDNGACASELRLTVTPGAHFDEDGRLVFGTANGARKCYAKT